MACYGGLQGILTGFTKSSDHESTPSCQAVGPICWIYIIIIMIIMIIMIIIIITTITTTIIIIINNINKNNNTNKE